MLKTDTHMQLEVKTGGPEGQNPVPDLPWTLDISIQLYSLQSEDIKNKTTSQEAFSTPSF